jgi:Beta-propeller repeat
MDGASGREVAMRALSKVMTVLAITTISGAALPARAGVASPALPESRSVAAASAGLERARIASLYGNLPLSFEANAGQVDRRVDFLCRRSGSTLFLSRGEALLRLKGTAQQGALVRLRLAGAARHPRGVGQEQQVTVSSYLIGNDRRRWRTGVANYSRVLYPEVYPGVALVYHGSGGQLEYDFVVAPGADPRRIRLTLEGSPALGAPTLGVHGELVLHTAQGDLVQQAPVLYQEGPRRGERERVTGRYLLLRAAGSRQLGEPARAEVGFAVGPYDRSRRLIIDPALFYATYLGGSGFDVGRGIAVDADGNAYVAGFTTSTSFPGVTPSSIQPAEDGSWDAFVTKINAAGTAVVYSTYLGGSGFDVATGIAVDGARNAYVTGWATSTTLPGVTVNSIQPTNAGGIDSFVIKVNAAGTAVVYATFLGGSGNDAANGIAVDDGGSVYVTGSTDSTTFPGVTAGSIQQANAGGRDAFLTKINAAGSAVVYSTFLGGSGNDDANGIAVDGNHNAYIIGTTASATFPGVTGGSIQPANGGGNDAFVTKVNAAGNAIVYSTFLGGSNDDSGMGIAVDGTGHAYVVGSTGSANFPGIGASSIQPLLVEATDAFVAKLAADGASILYGTFLGREHGTTGRAIAVDDLGNAYVTGDTLSFTFPGVTCASFQAEASGASTVFVTKIDAAGATILDSTLLGGTAGPGIGHGIAVDSARNAYVAGQTTNGFPVPSGSIQPAYGGGTDDAFVVKLGDPGGGWPPSPLSFYTVAPCRVFDSRDTAPLANNDLRLLPVAGRCGIPASAKTISANVTVVSHDAGAGSLWLFPGNLPRPSGYALTLPFYVSVRAENAMLLLACDGSGTIAASPSMSQGTIDLILDVNGYFQ